MVRARVRKPRLIEVTPDTFGGKLKVWRDMRGLRQEDLARFMGTDRTTIARYEDGDSSPANMRMFILALRHWDCLHDGLAFAKPR